MLAARHAERVTAATTHHLHSAPLADVPGPRGIRWLPPNWFASVMGTGAVAVCGAGLPWHVPGLHALDAASWALASLMLLALGVATAAHHRHRPAVARSYLTHPVLAHFYGTVPMALLVVGAATLPVGRDVMGARAAVTVDAVLWTVGTVGGVATLVGVPMMLARRGARVDPAFPGRLLPVVPPMVSAATGALLVPHAPHLIAVLLLVACYACFALATAASLRVAAGMVRRRGRSAEVPAAMVPVRWVVLGPLGQSVAAVNALAAAARPLVGAPAAHALRTGAIGFGVPVLALAAGWIGLSLVATGRAARKGLPFGLPWWSFTFPVATVVLGCERMAAQTGQPVYRAAAGVLFGALVIACAGVTVLTLRALARGRLTDAPS